MDFSKDIIIVILQLLIIKLAILNGWNVKRLNEKQIELTKECDEDSEYLQICSIIETSYVKVKKILN